MTRTGVVLALVVAGIVGVLVYLAAPVMVVLSVLLSGNGLIDPGVATAFQVMVFGTGIVLTVLAIVLTVTDAWDALRVGTWR